MRKRSGFQKTVLILSGVILLAGAVGALFLFGVIPPELKMQERETPVKPGVDGVTSEATTPSTEVGSTPTPGVVGSEVFDFSMYEESSEEYAQALDELEEPWFPRQAVVKPKGPEGGDYPNAPLPVYTAYPGQEGETEDGETYRVTRTWVGDIAVGTEVTLEGVAQQGEWCFVSGETIGGWNSSGWTWCYRLYIPE
jgi:hypothetical protein